MFALATAALSLLGLVAGQAIDFGSNAGTPQGLSSGVIYGEMLDDQIPQHFYTDMGLKYFRAGGAQLPAPNRGWSYGEYPGRFNATLTNYRQSRRAGAKFIILPHDVWGVDFRTDSYVWPGDNGNWTSYDNFLNQLISDVKANNMTAGLVWDIWNEADGYFWNGNLPQWLELYRRTHVRLRSDSALNGVLISGPTHAGYPSIYNPWWTEWAKMVAANKIFPDQYAWHQESGGDPTTSAYALAYIQQKYGLPTNKPININEYAVYNEMVAGGYAWYIAKFERLGWIGLLGNWQNGGNLYDCLSNLLTKNPGNFYDLSNTNYVPAAGYWIYNYYTKAMTGYKVNSIPTYDGNCDVFSTVGKDKVRVLTSCHFNTVNYNIAVNNLTAIGYPANGSVLVQVTKFNSTSNPVDPINAPFSVGNFTMQINNGVGSIPVFPVDTVYAYAFEWARA